MFPFGDARDWFSARRFGLFIHWGLYALNAWQEQDQWRRQIPRAEYERLAQRFNPVQFDPEAWLDVAEESGMEYVCFTTKHHDGFCLWDTAQTDYQIMNTPYGQDVLRKLADACQRRGMPLCLYYSVADWHHPNYPNQRRSHELAGPEPGDEPDLDRYLQFLTAQVRELCTQYGPIHGFWWDMNVTGVVDPSINQMIRELQPQAVINNRGFDNGDFGTPERDFVADEARVFAQRTEACQSVGRESWGYREHEDYYSDLHLMRSIDRALAKGGNYLLNVGPTAEGALPDEAVAILRRVGAWYNTIKEAFGDAQPASGKTDNPDVLLTERGSKLFVHLHREPSTRRVLLRPIDRMPRNATLLNTGAPVMFRSDPLPTLHMDGQGLLAEGKKEYLRLVDLPVNDLPGEVLVVKLEF
ncbi:MAG: alpha-L-fucosidase [Anaerolineae bacterium]|nr:alpha-L-fucosidase [Anaerolineae bacterium]